MKFHRQLTGTILALSGLTFLGCQQAVPTNGPGAAVTSDARFYAAGGGTEVDARAALEHLVTPAGTDWSTGSVFNREVAEMRKARAQAKRSRQLLQATDGGPRFLGTFTPPVVGRTKTNNRDGDKHNTPDNRDGLKHDSQNNAEGTKHGYAVKALSNFLPGAVSSIPAVSFTTNKAYWLGEDGTIYSYAMYSTAPPAAEFSITLDASDTSGPLPFPQTALTLEGWGGKFAYACSKDGWFYVIDLVNKTTVANHQMGGASGDVNFTAPPFQDAGASNYGASTVYAVTNLGTLYRFTVSATTGAISFNQPYLLPQFSDPTIAKELYRTPPTAYRGQVFVGSWIRDNVDRSYDYGGCYAYKTGVLAPSTTSTALAPVVETILDHPVYAPASFEFRGLDWIWGFMPTGNKVVMVNMQTGDKAYSQPLVVNDTSSLVGNPHIYNPALDDLTGIRNRPTVGFDSTVWVMNANAMFKLSFRSPTYDGTPNEYTNTGWLDRTKFHFSNRARTFYALSRQGELTGPTAGGKYIHNPCWVFYNGSGLFAMDNSGDEAVSNGVHLNAFGFGPLGGAPTRSSYFDLRRTGTAEEMAATEMAGMSFASDQWYSQFVFNTRSRTTSSTPAAGLWVYP